jgi:hypothetical protein
LVLRLSKPANDELNKLLRACNATARQFAVSQLYDSPPEQSLNDTFDLETVKASVDKSDAFHISLAWTLKEPAEQAQARLMKLQQDALQQLKAGFSNIKLKVGNAVNEISFTKPRNMGEG